ncbi:WD40-repeat-containing domain protein [Aspergillus caelatus]|uniref:Mitochondrial division protein 1 n=1 Tax=Aspergillus caelatus TaxID=61420 RepID=A0A5N6ZMF9_9EURO|nr:WD40-repeat-containing domain protein [Aspergillus caelatus]KAE8357360.1 WD40-repeat-containing domain protein [Aspergillus caelatus]
MLEGHLGSVFSVAFSPEGRLLASGSDDNTIRLWDPATGALQQTLESHSRSVRSVAFSPNGQLLASGSLDKTIRLWDPVTVRSVAFSLDGRLLASSSNDATIRLWHPVTGILQETLRTVQVVTKLAFSEDGSHLRTNLGSLHIQSLNDYHISHSPKSNLEIYLVQGDWLTENGEQVLWLPPEARPTCSALRQNQVVLGHASGRVSLIGFRVQ